MKIQFLKIAQMELDDAIEYYNSEVPGLGDAFLAMSNHVHWIIVIDKPYDYGATVETRHALSLRGDMVVVCITYRETPQQRRMENTE